MTHLLLVDHNNLGIMPSLSYLNTSKIDYREITCKSDIQIQDFSKQNSIPKVYYSIDDIQNKVIENVWDNKVLNSNTVVKMEEDDIKTSSNNNVEEVNDDFDYEFVEFQHEDDNILRNVKESNIDNETIKIEEEYANLYPISMKEARAAAKVSILCQKIGNFNCAICKKSFKNLKTLNAHLRMHDIVRSFSCYSFNMLCYVLLLKIT